MEKQTLILIINFVIIYIILFAVIFTFALRNPNKLQSNLEDTKKEEIKKGKINLLIEEQKEQIERLYDILNIGKHDSIQTRFEKYDTMYDIWIVELENSKKIKNDIDDIKKKLNM